MAVAFESNLEFFSKIKQKVAVISSPHKKYLCSTEAHMRVFVSAREGGEGGDGERERERFVGLHAGISYFLNVLPF